MSMNPTAVVPNLQAFGFGDKHNKLGRIESLEEKVDLLLKASEYTSNALDSTDVALTLQIENAKTLIMAELKGVAQDLAMIRAWKERLMMDHPELRSTTEPATTTRRSRMRRPTKMSDPPPSAPPRPGEEWKQTFNYPRRDAN
jgi:hypothetical protein